MCSFKPLARVSFQFLPSQPLSDSGEMRARWGRTLELRGVVGRQAGCVPPPRFTSGSLNGFILLLLKGA